MCGFVQDRIQPEVSKMQNNFRGYSGDTSGRAFAQGIRYFETETEAQNDSEGTGLMYEATEIKVSNPNAEVIRCMLYRCS
jgi:hypothetical protein